MAEAWSTDVLVLTVQLSEFRGVAGGVCRDGTYFFISKQLVIEYRHVTKPVMEAVPQTRRTRFGPYEVDLRSGEIHKHGIRLKLQDQPFQVLAILLEHSGEVVTRDELRQKLWPVDTFVDFDTGLNSAIKKLRDVLSDSADEPRYIEPLPPLGPRRATVRPGPHLTGTAPALGSASRGRCGGNRSSPHCGRARCLARFFRSARAD